jgi:hypothetical protein
MLFYISKIFFVLTVFLKTVFLNGNLSEIKPYLITLILPLLKERYPNHNANSVPAILIFALKII